MSIAKVCGVALIAATVVGSSLLWWNNMSLKVNVTIEPHDVTTFYPDPPELQNGTLSFGNNVSVGGNDGTMPLVIVGAGLTAMFGFWFWCGFVVGTRRVRGGMRSGGEW